MQSSARLLGLGHPLISIWFHYALPNEDDGDPQMCRDTVGGRDGFLYKFFGLQLDLFRLGLAKKKQDWARMIVEPRDLLSEPHLWAETLLIQKVSNMFVQDTSWLDTYLSEIPHVVYQVDDPKDTQGAQHATIANKGTAVTSTHVTHLHVIMNK